MDMRDLRFSGIFCEEEEEEPSLETPPLSEPPSTESSGALWAGTFQQSGPQTMVKQQQHRITPPKGKAPRRREKGDQEEDYQGHLLDSKDVDSSLVTGASKEAIIGTEADAIDDGIVGTTAHFFDFATSPGVENANQSSLADDTIVHRDDEEPKRRMLPLHQKKKKTANNLGGSSGQETAISRQGQLAESAFVGIHKRTYPLIVVLRGEDLHPHSATPIRRRARCTIHTCTQNKRTNTRTHTCLHAYTHGSKHKMND